MKQDINKRCADTITDVVQEIAERNWKRSIEATNAIASMLKSSGYGAKAFGLIMENLENAIRRELGQPLLDDYHHALKYRDHYLSNSVLILPRRNK